MAKVRRAFVVYECRHGWCFYPVENVYPAEPDRMRAFSKFSQLLWFVGKKVREDDAKVSQNKEGSAGVQGNQSDIEENPPLET